MSEKKTVVIGAGAAGLLCAGFAAQKGQEILVVDKNTRPARKVLITGKGRCNVTNNCTADEFLAQVCTNSRFLYAAINAFSPSDAMALFESLGVSLKTERGRRVFPVSDKAVDIADAMTQFARNSGAKLMQKTRVIAVLTQDGEVTGVELQSGAIIPAKAAVIATGGCSYPLTGSDGEGYRLARKLGHTIIQQRPSLVPIHLKERWCADLMGLSLKNITLTLIDQKNKKIFSDQGEMLFTHFGISGPLVLSASAYMAQGASQYRMALNLKPALSSEQLDARILRDFGEQQNKDFCNALDHLLPQKLIPIIVQLSGISGSTKVHSVTRMQRQILVELLQSLPLTPKAFGSLDEAVITAGGISIKEINPKTMGSKLIKGLFFAGEVIDVDAFTGGYNLQIAYSTAYVAAEGIIRHVNGGNV